MANYTYHLQQHSPTPAAIFREGRTEVHTWLAIGLGTATKEPELLNRMEQWLSTQLPTQADFELLLAAYLAWYRQSYQAAKNKECPLLDDEIVSSIGLVSVGVTGIATMINLGDCRLSRCAASSKQMEVITQGFKVFQLLPQDILIIDPKGADVAESLGQTLMDIFHGPINLGGPYPVAIVRAIVNSRSPKPLSKWIVRLVALMVVVGMGYVFQEKIKEWLPTSVLQNDSLSVADTTIAKLDTIVQEVPREFIPPLVQDTIVLPKKEVASDTQVVSPLTTVVPHAPTPNNSDTKVQQWLVEGNKAFNLAKAKEADGYNQDALNYYKAAKNNYERYIQLSPNQKATVDEARRIINRKIELLEREVVF